MSIIVKYCKYVSIFLCKSKKNLVYQSVYREAVYVMLKKLQFQL